MLQAATGLALKPGSQMLQDLWVSGGLSGREKRPTAQIPLNPTPQTLLLNPDSANQLGSSTSKP